MVSYQVWHTHARDVVSLRALPLARILDGWLGCDMVSGCLSGIYAIPTLQGTNANVRSQYTLRKMPPLRRNGTLLQTT